MNKDNIKKKDYYSLLLFGLIPAVLGIIQIINIGNYFLWLGVSISILLIHLNIQNSKIREDHLTGIYNRRQLDIYLNNSIKELDKNEVLFMMMIDIDDFKEIK